MDRPPRIAMRAKNQYGNFFDNELGSCEWGAFAGHFIGGEQRVFHDAGEEAQAKMYGLDLHTASAVRFFLR
jgi:hypothetical protein